MSSASTNLKGLSFPKKPQPMDNLSTGASTITKAYEIVHNRGAHFTESQFSDKQKVSEYNFPDDAVQRPKCVEPSIKLDYPRYVDPPQMGVMPCDEYDVSEFGPPNPEKSYDYPLACPACGGQMIMRCQVNGSGMITRHDIIHGELVHRSFDIVHFQPPDDAGRIARDIALEDEIPRILLQDKDMDAASLDGTECDFDTQNIIMEELQRQKPYAVQPLLVLEKKAKESKPDFGDVGFGSDNDDFEIVEVPNIVPNTVEATPDVTPNNGGDGAATAATKTSSCAEEVKSGTPTSPSDLVRSSPKGAVRGEAIQLENRRSMAYDDSVNGDERRPDHHLFFEKLVFNKDWKFGLFIDSFATDGFRKLELLTPQEGRIFITVSEELMSRKITGSDLIAFKPDSASANMTYIVKPMRYHNSYLTGRTRVCYGRDIQTETIALSACPSESLESLVEVGGRLKLWSDITGLIDVPAADIRKLMAGGIFSPLHLFRIRVSIPHVQNSTAAYMGAWKLMKMDAVFAGSKPIDIPDYYWPAGAERWDDVFVRDENSKEFILFSRSYPGRVIVAPRSHCRIAAKHMQMMLTAIVVLRGSQWFAFLVAPKQIAMQVTEDRLFDFTPKTHGYKPVSLSQKVKNVGMELQSRLVSRDDPLSHKDKMDLILGLGGTSDQLKVFRQSLKIYESAKNVRLSDVIVEIW